MELEDLANAAGITSDRLADPDVREQLRLALAKARGKRPSQVSVSLDTYRVLWRFLHDRETRGQGTGRDPFAGLPGDGY